MGSGVERLLGGGPSHALVLFVHGGFRAVVVVVVGVVLGLVVVGLMVVVVLWVWPRDALAFRWGVGARHQLQPFGLQGLVYSGDGFCAGLDGDRGRGLPPPSVRLADSGGGLWGMDGGALGDRGGMARDALGARSWFWFGLEFGLGRGHFWCCCCRAFSNFWGCGGRCRWCW